MWAAALLLILTTEPSPAVRAAAGLQEAARLEEAGDDPGAIRALQALLRRDPQQVEVRLELARLRLKSGADLDEVERLLQVARVHAPQDPRPHWHWASLMEERGKLWEAARSLERVLVAAPAHAEARFRVASLYERLGDPLHAEHHYRRLAKERPEWGLARLQLAAVLERQGRDEDAIRELSVLVRTQPQNAVARRRLGELYARTGRGEEAAKLLAPSREDQRRPLRPSRQ